MKNRTAIPYYTKKITAEDRITGEIEDWGDMTFEIKKPRFPKGFVMIWSEGISTKNLELKVLFWLTKYMSNKGVILVTNEQLSNNFEVTEKTIRSLKLQMKEEGFIKYKAGVIYINPRVIWKGSYKQREEAIDIFDHME